MRWSGAVCDGEPACKPDSSARVVNSELIFVALPDADRLVARLSARRTARIHSSQCDVPELTRLVEHHRALIEQFVTVARTALRSRGARL
jgi:hypothetical protein